MPKIHNIGKKHFAQFVRMPAKWDGKFVVRGWTQEIHEPFRTSTPLLFRLPFYRVFIVGKWTGTAKDEETALNRAVGKRVLEYEDFEEGWTPPAYKAPEKDFWATNL
jgi:hypothetical protein